MLLKEIFCQDRVISILQRAFSSGRVPHAYVFAGPDGVGKFTTAREFGKLLLCKNPVVENGFTDGCGLCESCRLFETAVHPDFNHIYKELLEFTDDGRKGAAPLELPIDVIRQFLIERVSLRPVLSARRVFIISESEKLNVSSQNCLLKVLEEPPSYCCIILLCSAIQSLFPTIRSRCQLIRFGPVSEDAAVSRLMKTGISHESACYFSRVSFGSLGLSLHLAELELAGAGILKLKRQLLESLTSRKYSDSVDLADSFVNFSRSISSVWSGLDRATSSSDINRRSARLIIRMIVSAFYDAMRLSAGCRRQELINFDQHDPINTLSQQFDIERLAGEIADCGRLLDWFDANVNEKLIFEQLLLNMSDSGTI